MRLLGEAGRLLVGDLVFGWRLAMEHALLTARAELLGGSTGDALRTANGLAADAERVGVPRYAATARLLVHQARAALGEPVDLAAAWRDLTEVESAVALESWWWAGEAGAALGEDRWLDRPEALADRLARASGEHRDHLRREADRRLAGWRVRMR